MNAGSFFLLDDLAFAGVSGVRNDSDLPAAFSLCQNYPNPFNPTTTIEYQLPMEGYITLKVFDVLGREVMTLVEGVEKPGTKSLQFGGTGLPSGVYYYRLQAGGFVQVRKLMLLK